MNGRTVSSESATASSSTLNFVLAASLVKSNPPKYYATTEGVALVVFNWNPVPPNVEGGPLGLNALTTTLLNFVIKDNI